MKIFFLALFLAIQIPAHTLGQSLSIKKGEIYRLPEEVKATYDRYLGERRAALLQQMKTLIFPLVFKDLKEVLSLIETRGSSFPNRQIHCDFLKRISGSLAERDHLELEELTHNFKLCIPADLPSKADGEKWGFLVLNFLWKKPWLMHQGKLIALPEYIRRSLEIKDFIVPKLIFWSNSYPDAGYSSLSLADKKFLESSSSVSAFFDRIQKHNINDLESISGFSKELVAYAKEDTLSFVDVFIKYQNIYFSPSWGPADMVDTLIHEYGHIYFDLRHGHFTGDDKVTIYEKSRFHDEACAEMLAWILLREFYDQYPEIEFGRVLKQYAFSKLRPLDPHYVGAGAAYFIFNTTKRPFKEYKALAEAKDFRSYVESKSGTALIREGESATKTLPLK